MYRQLYVHLELARIINTTTYTIYDVEALGVGGGRV